MVSVQLQSRRQRASLTNCRRFTARSANACINSCSDIWAVCHLQIKHLTNPACYALCCTPLPARPADLRVDTPRLAPLAPLTPPQLPPGNPQPTASANQQQPQQQQGSGSSSEPAAAAPAGLAPLCCPLGLSLFHPADRRWLGWLQQLWPKRGKDALLLLRKWLKEALRQERITPGQRSRLSSVVSPAELAGLAQCLMASPGDDDALAGYTG